MQTVREPHKMICHKTKLITIAESGGLQYVKALNSRRSYTDRTGREKKKGKTNEKWKDGQVEQVLNWRRDGVSWTIKSHSAVNASQHQAGSSRNLYERKLSMSLVIYFKQCLEQNYISMNAVHCPKALFL
jgi:hypothetical protein